MVDLRYDLTRRNIENALSAEAVDAGSMRQSFIKVMTSGSRVCWPSPMDVNKQTAMFRSVTLDASFKFESTHSCDGSRLKSKSSLKCSFRDFKSTGSAGFPPNDVRRTRSAIAK